MLYLVTDRNNGHSALYHSHSIHACERVLVAQLGAACRLLGDEAQASAPEWVAMAFSLKLFLAASILMTAGGRMGKREVVIGITGTSPTC